MPNLNAILHSSIVDRTKKNISEEITLSDCLFQGSTLKELTLRWQPIRHTKRPHKEMTHRARDDIQESINELNHYRQQ